jgi:hypothetical protein
MKVFSKKRLGVRPHNGFVFFVDPASHYHGAAGSEEEIRKNGREIF